MVSVFLRNRKIQPRPNLARPVRLGSSIYMRRQVQVAQCLPLARGPGRIIFSGIQPTGVPHLGNYLGAMRQWCCLQNEASTSTRLLYSIVDLHAITSQQEGKQLRQQKQKTLAALMAIGLDPERSTIFYQSAVWIEGLRLFLG